MLANGKAKRPSKLKYWECLGLLRSLELNTQKGPKSIEWYYGHRYGQCFRIYIEALINSPKKLSLARDDDDSCEARLIMKSRPSVKKISDCTELMQKYCSKIFTNSDNIKPFMWLGTKELNN